MPIQRMLPASGSFDEVIWLYCGRVNSRNAAGVHGLAEEHEDIRVIVKTVAEIGSDARCRRDRERPHAGRARTGCCATATACARNGPPGKADHGRDGRNPSDYPHATFLKCFDSARPWRW